MRSLFWKMFFGAWITAVVMVVATVYVTQVREVGDPRLEDRWESAALFRQLSRNLRMTRRHGPESFRFWLERQPPEARDRIYAIDRSGAEILGRAIPRDMAPLFQVLSFRNREDHGLVNNKPTVAFFMPQRDGDSLRVAFIAGSSKEELLLRFILRNFWPMLLLSALASGIACYWLARYLSRPLDKLRAATRRVAAGELDYRVSPALARRGDELSELAEDFDSMTAQLQSSMAEQRRLIKDVSHELRSPLARLQVALGIARQKSDGRLDGELDRIGKAADYLEDIIADVLSLPVAGADQRPLDDVVEVGALLNALTEDLGPEARAKNLQVRPQLAEEELLVATRGSSLTAALENILRNAIKYSPAGSSVTVIAGSDGQLCKIQVIDSGSGVEESELQAIFRPFYRTDSARTRDSGGVGLGLAIAQRTISHHGGEISARNVAEGGLCVEISLPLLSLGEH
ncbi:Sensor protein CpxA [Microbulbifer aggregans]|uniref:histidine kinase n=1 Tax=Microbulbifer aggregans TaxID=1769779 RepID=A0A1C9WBL3_9GAMM|nr:ATP-binding protein [Microbulbifer aggregans]AOS98532.1 Sensor protein CpxA [Microbulbifer aggregans]